MEKKVSKRTKDTAKLSRLFLVLSFLCFVGVAIFTVFACFSHIGSSEEQGMDIISEQLKSVLVSTSVTIIIVTILALIIKNKVRTTVYMLSLIVNGILFKEVGMYIILAIWALDEYVFTSLHKHYQKLKVINKEIDLRV